MHLTETGESRVNGYLFVLERSLRTFLPGDVVRDAVREIESHVRERIATADGAPDERVALEKILSELGPPLKVAQAYSTERTIDEAVTTGRVVPVMRAVWHLAATTLHGFFAALLVVVGYLSGAAFLVIAALKPVFPDNVGFWGYDGWRGYPTSLAIRPIPPTGEVAHGGYWVIPFAVVMGLGILVLTHKCARRFLSRMMVLSESASWRRTMKKHLFGSIVFAAVVAIGGSALAQQVTKENVAGIRNLSRLETTVACAGATEVDAIPTVKKMGFVAMINLRQASEAGANVPESQAAAKAAGLNYVHIPMDSANPDPAVADKFLEAIRNPANQPAYIHCASANRASAMWFLKRVQIDKWDTDRAMKEAEALGLTSEPLKKFVLSYVQSHK